MLSRLAVRPQGILGRFADSQFEQVMRYVSGAPKEATQRTHRWNNHHLSEAAVSHLRSECMVRHEGDPDARKLPRVPILAGSLAHMTRFGGWQQYLVLGVDAKAMETVLSHRWYIGWRWKGGAGVSRIPTLGALRVLVGPQPTEWFGIGADETVCNMQIPIRKIAEGRIGDEGRYSKLPLF